MASMVIGGTKPETRVWEFSLLGRHLDWCIWNGSCTVLSIDAVISLNEKMTS
jgi:hypothetical protein